MTSSLDEFDIHKNTFPNHNQPRVVILASVGVDLRKPDTTKLKYVINI